MSEGRRCKVILLNGQRLDIVVQSKLKTSDLIEISLSHFFVKEQHCFGLYTIQSNYVYWLDPKKNVLENEFLGGEGSLTIYLGVRFYLKSTSMLCDLKAIELFYLQARSHVSQGLLVCDGHVLCYLASLALQFEYKDFESDAQFTSILARSQVLPAKLPKDSSLDYESETRQKYKDLSGMSRGEALVMYLKTVESQPMYGVHFYQVKDKRGNCNWLGISVNGMVVVERDARRPPSQARTRTYKWSQLENIFHNERKFHFEERRITTASNNRHQQFPSSDVILHSFLSETPSMARCIWSSCVDQHHFYLESIKMDPVRNSLDKLARELDESFTARREGHRIDTFHSERFKQMTEVVQQLKTKKSLLDSLLKDKMNLIKRLEEEESAITKEPPSDVHPIDKSFKEKWETAVISYDHYEANKTLSALDDIFKVEQKVTVGYYKLIVLHNNTTARLVNRMMSLQMTPGKDLKSKNQDLRKKWVEMYKSSLGKLKAIERKVNKYRRVLNMSCVDFASRFEDHKITKRPVSDGQKQMVCRCPNHSHKVLHRQQQHDVNRGSYDSRASKDIANTLGVEFSTPLPSKFPPPPNLKLPPIPDQINKTFPSPSTMSMEESASSSSSSSLVSHHHHHHHHHHQEQQQKQQQQHVIPNTTDSSSVLSTFVACPHVQGIRRTSHGEVSAYPENKHRPVAKNHSCDDLGLRSSHRGGGSTHEGVAASPDQLKTRSCRPAEGRDVRNIRGLNKRFSYRMALESSALDAEKEMADFDGEDDFEDDDDDDDDDDDNLYNVSNNRKAHVLTRSSSTNQGSSYYQENKRHAQQSSMDQQTWQNLNKCHHHHHHHHSQQHHHHHPSHCECDGVIEKQGTSSQKCENHHRGQECHHRHHPHLQLHHQHHHHHQSSSTMQRDEQLWDSRNLQDAEQTTETVPWKSLLRRSERQKADECGPQHHIYQCVPSDKQSSVMSSVSSKMKPAKSTPPRTAQSSVTCAVIDADFHRNLTSCFKPQRKNIDAISDESSRSLRPLNPQDGKKHPGTSYDAAAVGMQRSFVQADGANLSMADDPGWSLGSPIVAGTSFVQAIHGGGGGGGGEESLIATGLFLDTCDSSGRFFMRDFLRDQHLRTEDYNKCMEHFRNLQVKNFGSNDERSQSRDPRTKRGEEEMHSTPSNAHQRSSRSCHAHSLFDQHEFRLKHGVSGHDSRSVQQQQQQHSCDKCNRQSTSCHDVCSTLRHGAMNSLNFSRSDRKDGPANRH